MNLISVRLITADVEKLMNFYGQITGYEPVLYTPDFAEVQTKNATLAIGSTRTLQAFGGDHVAKAAENRTAIIECKVDDVDQGYENLGEYLQAYLVQKPTTMPAGNRSLLFRDPDGNLVNFFTPLSAEAIEKFKGR